MNHIVFFLLVFQTKTVQQSSNDTIFYIRKGQSKWNRAKIGFTKTTESQTTWHQKHHHGLLEEVWRTHAGRLWCLKQIDMNEELWKQPYSKRMHEPTFTGHVKKKSLFNNSTWPYPLNRPQSILSPAFAIESVSISIITYTKSDKTYYWYYWILILLNKTNIFVWL